MKASALALTLAVLASAPSARAQGFGGTLTAPTTTQFGPPTQPAPNSTMGADAAAPPSAFSVSATTSPLGHATTGFATAPFNSPGAPFTQTGPAMPFNSPGASFGGPPSVVPATIPAPPAPSQPALTPPARSTAPAAAPPLANPVRAQRGAIRLLDENNVEQHRRLSTEFSRRRRALVDSDDWRAASRYERKAKLKTLKAEFQDKERVLREDYLRRRAEVLQASGASAERENAAE